ncbi:Ubiquitin carboxyl-terminal hydrolase 30 [Chionoecetes opilio]|uniref:Ubiquitin carboxyl-terminal hydrolase n=1 Tax=Chionoecetes opilio TaxID=41210 RepID=A0A8J4YNH1_CHIOP|nr:Ubiquitin carboxyl-terminal hydrolase 30 [Chionoecetes opilio]
MDWVLDKVVDQSDCGASVGNTKITDLVFADDAVIFAESLEVLVMALEALHEEAKPLGLKVSWLKTKVQVFGDLLDEAVQKMFDSSVWLKSCLLAGTLLIGAYVIFGGTVVTRRRRRRKDGIPGLANIGNSCFLNALVQSLASCPMFVAWLAGRHTERAPPLLNTLHNLLKALNNEGETSGDACAGEVLGALRGHGWVITSEEQDTHELFHVLTTTIEDEIISGAPVPSLLDISWLDVKREEGPSEGVTLRAASWRLKVAMHDMDTKSNKQMKEELNGILYNHVREFANFGVREERGGGGGGAAEVNRRCDGNRVSGCDEDGCESYAVSSDLQEIGQCDDDTNKAFELQETVGHSVRSRLSSREKTNNKNVDDKESQGHTDISFMRSCVVPPECDDNKNVKQESFLHKTSRRPPPQPGRSQAANSGRRKSRSDHQQDISFRGYLASQLQCTVCGHRNPAQWSSFESLSLSLPSLPWGEVSLQELLGAYTTREQVSGVSCEGCSHAADSPVKTTFTKQLTIGKLPDCLCFHVKRTVWLENGSAIKRRDHVTFPEILVMDPYTYTTSITMQSQMKAGMQSRTPSEGTGSKLLEGHPITALNHSSTPSPSEQSPLPGVVPLHYDQLYRLQAIIVHVGDVFCGHFVTYRRGPANSRSKNRWFYTSDLLVREASLEEVRKANAYMILYEKVV